MSGGINLRRTLSRTTLAESGEQQLVYILLEAQPEGSVAQVGKLPLNLCLVLDRSSSMRGERLNQMRDAIGKIIDQLDQNDYISLVTFNDRADIVLSAQRVNDKADLKRTLNRIEAAGGTEMANGMALGLQEIQRPILSRAIHRMLVLTDGRTYGDESKCVELARRAQSRGIGLIALGIGNEWNEDLLETMTARENSRAQYITNANEMVQIFADEIKRMHSIFAQQVQLTVAARPGAQVRSVDRVRPFIASVPIQEEAELRWVGKLGDWPSSDPQLFLIEVVVPALGIGDHPLVKLTLQYNASAGDGRTQTRDEIVRIGIRAPDAISPQVDANVKYWLERLVAYRLQSRAWQDVEAGRIEDATRRLKMAGTRLFEAGEVSLAQTVQEEATRLLRSGSASDEGKKRIRFGTRGLMGKEPASET
jgi:uncharacterized protein YegL